MSVTEFPLERRMETSEEFMRRMARERRARLFKPHNSRASSEIEVVSPAVLRNLAPRPVADRFFRPDVINTYPQVEFYDHVVAIPSAFAGSPINNTFEPPLIDETTVWPITIRDVARAACRFFSVSMLDLVSTRRPAEIVRARHITMYLARELTKRSTPEIGRVVGGRDHTTVLSALKHVRRRLRTDPTWAADIDAVRSAVLDARAESRERPITG